MFDDRDPRKNAEQHLSISNLTHVPACRIFRHAVNLDKYRISATPSVLFGTPPFGPPVYYDADPDRYPANSDSASPSPSSLYD
ncbi:hypothetical protein CIB48_g5540, partial [Xylaria polymorpha]